MKNKPLDNMLKAADKAAQDYEQGEKEARRRARAARKSKPSGLKPGDKVKMVGCREARIFPNKIWIVCSEPWDHCGSEVVQLKGKCGGFATEFLEKIL